MGLKWYKNKIKESPYQLRMQIISDSVKDKLSYSKYLEKIEDKVYERITNKTNSNIALFGYRYWSSDWKNITGYSLNNFLQCKIIKENIRD